jgi:hypothetical protein
MLACKTILSKEFLMLTAKNKLNLDRDASKPAEKAKAAPGRDRAYEAPTLHVVGRAGELVQGGGGNYADNNRARQY